MEEVERLCQRVAIMDNGSIIAEESIANIRKLLPQTNEVVVELEGNVSKLTAALPGTQRQELNETTLTLEIADLNRDLPRALMALSDLGIRYQSVRTQEGTLEEVFLHLTGKTLRD
jgi:ABC-2 type transport system ATP-binding protein